MTKGQEDIKTCLDIGLKSLSDQLKQLMNQDNSGELISSLSALSDKIDTQMVKLQSGLHKDFCKEIQAIFCSMKMSKQKQATPSIHELKAVSVRASPQEVQFPCNITRRSKAQQTSLLQKVETGGWTSVKQERAEPKGSRVVIESDEESDGELSCLFNEQGADIDKYSVEEAKQETARILRKARRRKRKYCNTIIIN